MNSKALATLIALGSLAACSFRPGDPGDGGLPGLMGPQGPAGPAGPRGDAGAPRNGQLIIKDATGALVSRAVGMHTNTSWGPSAVYVDERGYLWRIDAETGLVQTIPTVLDILYSQPNCSGDAYVTFTSNPVSFVYVAAPRMPFRIPGENFYRVRPDTMRLPSTTYASYRRPPSNDCYNNGSSYETRFLLPLTDDTLPSPPVSPPNVSFVPPLHRERE